jgi:hypothetical protein
MKQKNNYRPAECQVIKEGCETYCHDCKMKGNETRIEEFEWYGGETDAMMAVRDRIGSNPFQVKMLATKGNTELRCR